MSAWCGPYTEKSTQDLRWVMTTQGEVAARLVFGAAPYVFDAACRTGAFHSDTFPVSGALISFLPLSPRDLVK